MLKDDEEFAEGNVLNFIPGLTIEAGEAGSPSTITIQNLYKTLTQLSKSYCLDLPPGQQFLKREELNRGGTKPVSKGGSKPAPNAKPSTPLRGGSQSSVRGRANQVSANAAIMNFSGIVQSVNDKARKLDDADKSKVEFTAFADLINRYNMVLNSPPSSPRRSPVPADLSKIMEQLKRAGADRLRGASSPTSADGSASSRGRSKKQTDGSRDRSNSRLNETRYDVPSDLTFESRFDVIWKKFVREKNIN